MQQFWTGQACLTYLIKITQLGYKLCLRATWYALHYAPFLAVRASAQGTDKTLATLGKRGARGLQQARFLQYS